MPCATIGTHGVAFPANLFRAREISRREGNKILVTLCRELVRVARQRYFPQIIWECGKVANLGQLVCRECFVNAHGKDIFAEGTSFVVRYLFILPCQLLCRALLLLCAVKQTFAVRSVFPSRQRALCRVP